MRAVAITAISLLVTLAAPGCVEDENCVNGVACVCSAETCTETCGGSGAGCSFDCLDGSDCTFACPGGSCSVEADSAEAMDVSCPGGGCGVTAVDTAEVTLDCTGDSCSLSCVGADVCRLTGCTFGCALSCGGAAVCESSCSAIPGGCSVSP